jgi:hypothetical protein
MLSGESSVLVYDFVTCWYCNSYTCLIDLLFRWSQWDRNSLDGDHVIGHLVSLRKTCRAVYLISEITDHKITVICLQGPGSVL